MQKLFDLGVAGPGAVVTGDDKKLGKMHLLQVGDWSKEEQEYFSPRT